MPNRLIRNLHLHLKKKNRFLRFFGVFGSRKYANLKKTAFTGFFQILFEKNQ